jgi:hypothetical protein
MKHHCPVRNLDTRKIYPDINAAAKSVYVAKESLRNAIRLRKRCGGYRWQYAPDMALRVLCIETGQTFATVQEAGRFYQTNPANISKVIAQGGTTKGYSFRWIDPLKEKVPAITQEEPYA